MEKFLLRILAGILYRPVDLFVLKFMRDDFTLSTFIYWNMKLESIVGQTLL